MSSGIETTSARKRPPELSLSSERWDGVSNSTVGRQRREVVGAGSSSGQQASAEQAPSSSSQQQRVSSRRHRRREPAASLLSKAQKRLEGAAAGANVGLEKQFRRHGRYISRHPVRTLLVACLIITSLFYPAAGIYLWASKGGPGVTRGDARSVWRSLSTPFLDSFASSGRKHHNSLRDLRMIWDDAPDLRAVDARDADAYLGSITPLNLLPNPWPAEHGEKLPAQQCSSVRIEHIFVTTDDVMMEQGPRFGALDVPILQSALSLQDTIESFLKKDRGGLSCIQASSSPDCLTLSPLSFWHNDPLRLARDTSPTATLLGSTVNMTLQGIPLSPTTTLAGRSHLFAKFPRSDHLVLTFFLHDDEECQESGKDQRGELLSKSHAEWLAMLRNITGERVGILSSEINATKELILHFVPVHSGSTLFIQRLFLASGYLAVFVWLSKSLMKIQNVHSRFGLAFTGVIELVISMTLAISICALCGVRLTLVPWEILPFVVVVIGSENMFVLTNAIISTPISLTASSRVATGLEKVGVPIAVTVLSDLLLMTVIMMLVDVGAVREFCIFAVFSLFVDFFMQMTLYSTVLSIDLQRLELADLLSQGGGGRDGNSKGGMAINAVENESNGSDPSASIDGHDEPVRVTSTARTRHLSGGSLIKMSCRAMWRARTARTASLSLLLAFMFGIYLYHGSGYPSHQSYPFSAETHTPTAPLSATSTQSDSETPRFDPFAHLSGQDSGKPTALPLPWWHNSPSASFWHTLNPNDAPSVRIKIEPWTVISLRSPKTFEGAQRSVAHFASWAIFRPRVRAIIWFFKLVVLPISGTTGLLWVLLLYLLKDTELLDAQQNKSNGVRGDEEDEEEAEPKEEERMNDLDISLRLSNTAHAADVELIRQSGGFVVSLAADSTLCTWRPSKKAKSRTVVLSATLLDYTKVTAMEVNAKQDLVALGHASGAVSFLSMTSLQAVKAAPKEQNGDTGVESGLPSSRVQSILILPTVTKSTVASIHSDGSIWTWSPNSHHHPLAILSPQHGARWMAFSPLASQSTCPNLVALSSSDRHFQVYRISIEAPYLACLLSAHDSPSVVRCAAMSTLVFGDEEQCRGNTWSTVVAGTSAGSIVVYDLINSASAIGQYDVLDGPVTSVRLVDYMAACPSLGYVGNRDVILAHSTNQATVMALCTLADCSPGTGASKGALLTPYRRRRDVSASYSLPSIETTPSRPTDNRGKEASPKEAPVQSNGNGHGMMLETPSTPLPLPLSNGPRHRRMSSQGRKGGLNEEGVFFSGEVALPTSGSSRSSVLGHFDVDPFELHGEAQVQWSRLASIDCVRGGADIVMTGGGAKVVGVCKRSRRQAWNAGWDDVRWEVFELDIERLYAHQRTHLSPQESGCLKRSRLDLEDAFQADGSEGPATGSGSGTSTPPTKSIRFALPSRSSPSLLSFARLDQVQAYYKEQGPGQEARKKSTVVFSFANSLAVVHLYPSPTSPLPPPPL